MVFPHIFYERTTSQECCHCQFFRVIEAKLRELWNFNYSKSVWKSVFFFTVQTVPLLTKDYDLCAALATKDVRRTESTNIASCISGNVAISKNGGSRKDLPRAPLSWGQYNFETGDNFLLLATNSTYFSLQNCSPRNVWP